MNCKQGDLAIVVRCLIRPDLIGRLVECIALAPAGPTTLRLPDGNTCHIDAGLAPSWVVRFQGAGYEARNRFGMSLGVSVFGVTYDANLRPIRDQPGEDETLTWAGLPQEQGVAA